MYQYIKIHVLIHTDTCKYTDGGIDTCMDADGGIDTSMDTDGGIDAYRYMYGYRWRY